MGKEIHQSIVIDAKVRTTLENMSKTVSELQEGLNKGITNLDMSKGIGNSLSKTLTAFRSEFSKFSDLTKSGSVSFIDSKEAIRSGEEIIKKYREIQRVVGNLNDLKIIDAKKLFPDAFNSEITGFQNKLASLQQNLNNLEVKGIEVSQAETKLSGLIDMATTLQNKLIEETPLQVAVTEAESKLKSAQEEVDKIREALREELKLKLDTADLKKGEISKQIEAIESARAARGTKDLAMGSGGHATYKGKTSKQWRDSGASKEQIEAAQAAIQAFAQEEKQLSRLREALAASEREATKLRNAFANFGEKTDLTKTAENLGKSSDEIEQTKTALENQANAAAQAKLAQEQLNAAQTKNRNIKKDIESNSQAIQEQQAKVEKLRLQYDNLFGKIDVSKLQEGLEKTLGKDFSPEMLKNQEGIEQLLARLREADEKDFSKLKNSLQELGVNADTAEDYVRQLRDGLTGIGGAASSIKQASQDMEQLKNRVLYFFSLTNSVQLFRRAVIKALNTVKELDATMTEAAVVTEFDIGDMWEKLPEYSKNAQALGVSINGMYQATTLYYQQGLKTNEAMALGVETMKMAKIAGIESADATTAMTAALRGFNMELNETSAIRVNDVYSQLAAVTAADVNQISTAMEKTASIAASANMEFETTAALLAQIIETTQEAPETAGTALKTIIARFSEVKTLKQSGKSTGEDTEGEAIDVNKIQTALRTVGISMEGFFSGTEGLDSILLKLSEKWGTLDFETQRYIATMAAGSRQQSRFIAMMSDYGRTTELVGQAQNSAGASQKQFEKTQSSLATSIQRLENAWNEFLMGLANNEVLKFAVDSLTFIIEAINKITDAISGGNGLIKSLVSLMGVIGALKLGKGILSGTGVTNMLGNLTGRATTMKETITETAGANGATVRTIVREPVKEGQSAGSQAGQGFIAGFRGTITKDKTGAKSVKGFLKKNAAQSNAVVTNTLDEDAFKKHLAQEEIGLNPDDLSERAMGVRKINEQLAEGQITTNEAAEAYKKLGGSVDQFSIKTEQTAAKAKQLSINMQSVGTAAIGIGAALGLLSSLFEKAGLEEWAEPISTLAGVFMGLGGAIKTLTMLFPALGQVAIVEGGKIAIAGYTTQLAWWWVLLIVAAVAALIVLIVKLAQAAKKNSIENRMKEAAEATEAAKQAAQEAKDAYEELLSDRSEYDTLQDKLRTLTKGTIEWKQAIADANSQVLEMLETYPELAKYIERGDGGNLSISDEGWDQLVEKQLQGIKNTQTGIIQAQLNEVRLQEENAWQAYEDAGGLNGFWDIADAYKQSNDTAALNSIYDAFVADFKDDKNLFAKNENGDYSSELIALAGSVGYTAEQIAALEESLSKAQSYELGMLNENYAQATAREYAIDILGDSARGVGIKAAGAEVSNYYEIDTQALERIYTAYVEDPAMFLAESSAEASDKLHILAGEVGQSSSELLNMKNSLATYHKSMMDIEAKKRGFAVSSLTAMASEEMLADSLGDNLLQGFAGGYEAQTKAQADAIQNALHSGSSFNKITATSNNAEFTALASKYNVDSSQLTNDETANLKKVYAAMTNVSEDSITDDAATLAKKIAEIEAGNKYGEKVSQIYDKFKTLSKIDQKKYATAISKDYTKASQQDLKSLAAMDSADYEEMAKRLGYTDAQTFATEMLGYQDIVNANGDVVSSAFEQMMEDMKKTAEYGMVEFEVIKERAAQSEINIDKNYLRSVTAEQLQNYTDLMSEALAKGGTKGLQDFSTSFDEIMRYASEEQKTMILDSLDSFDFSQEGEAQQFFAFLESIGMYLPYDAVNDFTNELKDLQDGFRLISLSALRDEIKEYLDLADQLEGREDSEGLTDEERQQMLDAGLATEDDFAWNGQTWLYLEGPMADLAKAIRENTGALLQKTKEDLEEQVKRGHQIEELVGNDIDGYLQQTVYDSKGDVHYLAYTVQDLLDEKINDPAYLRQLFGLSGDMTDAEVMQYYKDSIAAYGQLAANENSLLQMENRSNFLVDTSNINPMAWGDTSSEYRAVTTGAAIQPIYGQDFKMIDASPGATTVSGGPTLEQQTQLKALAKEYGVSQATIDDFTKAMKTSNVEQRNAATTAIKNEIEQKKQEKQYGKTLSKLSAVGEEYGTVTEGMQGYDEALRAYASAIGTDDYAFVAENMELIQQAAQGDIDSIMELNRLLAEKHGLTITAEGNFDPYNVAVDEAGRITDEFIEQQYEAGAYELVEITTESEAEYVVPYVGEDGQTHFKVEKIASGQTVQVLRPQDASSIARSQTLSGSSSSSAPEPYKNTHDKSYNTYEKINSLMRERERIERRYDKLLKSREVSGKNLLENAEAQLANLELQRQQQERLRADKGQEILDLIAENSEYADLVTGFDMETGEITINWEAFDALTDAERGEGADEYLSALEGLRDQYLETGDSLDEILDIQEDIRNEGQDQWFSLEDQIKNALVAARQEEIDKLTNINESINETNSKIIEQLQESLNEYRQNRDNQKTEEELSDKQRKLAYLQQDTSGANATEILRLQKEIEEGQENYTDQLIDQKISELQAQNDKAAEQRERQISLLEDQLAFDERSGVLWDKVYELWETGVDENGRLIEGGPLEELLKTTADYTGLSALGKEKWRQDLAETVANAFGYVSGKQVAGVDESVTFKTKDGKELTGVSDGNGNVKVGANTYKVYKNHRGEWVSDNEYQAEPPEPTIPDEEEEKEIVVGGKIDATGAKIYASPGGEGKRQYFADDPIYNVLDEKNGYLKTRWYRSRSNDVTGWFKKSDVKAYKTGGLADFTGPAWLDGTKSKPEYILNADQTKAFFHLVDVLSSLQSGSLKPSQISGDNTFDIDINVESIGSDYDVEQMAETIKRLINEDARYRNNNAINLMR